MVDIAIYVITLFLVAVSSRGLLSALTESTTFNVSVGYSMQARRLGQKYKVFAWGMMLSLLIISLIKSFIDVFLSF